jgi:hypothetical protein
MNKPSLSALLTEVPGFSRTLADNMASHIKDGRLRLMKETVVAILMILSPEVRDETKESHWGEF